MNIRIKKIQLQRMKLFTKWRSRSKRNFESGNLSGGFTCIKCIYIYNIYHYISYNYILNTHIYIYIYSFITKASFAGLELPRLLNKVKYSNIRGERPFVTPKSKSRLQVKSAGDARITFFFTTETP